MDVNLEPRECPDCPSGWILPRCASCGEPLIEIDKHGHVTAVVDHSRCDTSENPWWRDECCTRCATAGQYDDYDDLADREAAQEKQWEAKNER